MYYVIRPPSTMEDAGRSFLEFTAASEQEAIAWVEKQVATSHGYFTKDCFKITRAQRDF